MKMSERECPENIISVDLKTNTKENQENKRNLEEKIITITSSY